MAHSRARHTTRWLFLIPLCAAVALLAQVTLLTLHASRGAVAGVESDHESWVPATALMVATISTWLAYWWPRRGPESGVGLALGGFTAAIVLTLGVATYGPCVPQGTWAYVPLSWVLSLFTGDYEFEGPGSVCALRFPPGLELARGLGMLLTVSGVLGVVSVLARRQLDRWRVSLCGDADVVIGLDRTTLPLVGALLDENRSHRGRDGWIDTRPAWRLRSRPEALPGQQGRLLWWWTGLRPGDLGRVIKAAPRTIVVDLDPENPLVAEVRRMGALVLFGDASDPTLMRTLVSRFRFGLRRRTALRRLYAVTPEQQRNLAIWRSAVAELSGAPMHRHLDSVVPRVFVRMGEAREARQWRVSQLQILGHPTATVGGPARGLAPGGIQVISDSLTVDGIAAENIVARILPSSQWLAADAVVPHVVLVGQGDLALAILDELAWQHWCRFEIAAQVGRGAEAARPKLARVTLAGPNARTRKSEWDDLRAPWTHPHATEGGPPLELFEVVDSSEDPEQLAARAWANDPDAVVVFVDESAEYTAAASRLARRAPGPPGRHERVIVRGDDDEAESEPIVAGGLMRFVPGLVGRTPTGMPEPPTDSVTRLARQQHMCYRATDGWVVGGGAGPSARRASTLTSCAWEDLPAFFREDNVRQHWQVISWFIDDGYDWAPVTVAQAQPHLRQALGAGAWEDAIDRAARSEYERWASLRRAHGWWAGARNDSLRVHPDLQGWDDVDKGFNRAQVDSIVSRIWATGLAPIRQREAGTTGAEPGATPVPSRAAT